MDLQHGKFKTSPKYHFGVTKKDPGLVFHFPVLNLFKYWSNLDLTNIRNKHKKFETNQKKEKNRAYIIFLCHILTIILDKQGLYTFIRKIHVSTVIYLKLWHMSLRLKRRGFGFATWKIQKPHQSIILE